MIVVTVCCDDCGRELGRSMVTRASLRTSSFQSESVTIPRVELATVSTGDQTHAVIDADVCARCVRERVAIARVGSVRPVQMCRHGLPDCDLCAAAGLPPYGVKR